MGHLKDLAILDTSVLSSVQINVTGDNRWILMKISLSLILPASFIRSHHQIIGWRRKIDFMTSFKGPLTHATTPVSAKDGADAIRGLIQPSRFAVNILKAHIGNQIWETLCHRRRRYGMVWTSLMQINFCINLKKGPRYPSSKRSLAQHSVIAALLYAQMTQLWPLKKALAQQCMTMTTNRSPGNSFGVEE